jgi:hypothetical protein
VFPNPNAGFRYGLVSASKQASGLVGLPFIQQGGPDHARVRERGAAVL